MKLSNPVIALLATSLIALSGCCCNKHEKDAKSASAAAPGAMNTTCPLSGRAVNASVTSEHEGKKVAFCCAGCKGKFDAMTAAKKSETMASAH